MQDGRMTTPAELVAAARSGDAGAFEQLVAPYRGELIAHCYRMLGSLDDAEDAVQESLVRAWRSVGHLDDRGFVRAWLYKIATNRCLTAIERRGRRELPVDVDPGRPATEINWLEPYPDPSPEARYLARESVELAFVAALQHLSATQRAVLILREVLGFSAAEVAVQLDTSPASVNSALQRARAKLATLDRDVRQAPMTDEHQRSLLERYVQAWESGDLERFVALLKEDAVYAMPPWREWYRGRGSIGDFFGAVWPAYRGFRLVPVGANLQPAFALYTLGAEGRWNAHSIQLLSLDKDGIATFTAFMQPLAQKLFTAFQMPTIRET